MITLAKGNLAAAAAAADKWGKSKRSLDAILNVGIRLN